METIKVLVAVKSEALARVIQHVLHGQPGISGIDFADSEHELMEQAQRLRPDLIIVNSRLFGRAAGAALTQLKRTNPLSKLILTCNFEEYRSIDSDIFDARVLDETLVQQLPAIARRLMSGCECKPDRAQPSRNNRTRARNSIVQKFGLVLTLFFLSFAGSAFAQHTDSATHAPPNYYSLPPSAGYGLQFEITK
jgi:DNA-binding NarL/FixJ family response regulator